MFQFVCINYPFLSFLKKWEHLLSYVPSGKWRGMSDFRSVLLLWEFVFFFSFNCNVAFGFNRNKVGSLISKLMYIYDELYELLDYCIRRAIIKQLNCIHIVFPSFHSIVHYGHTTSNGVYQEIFSQNFVTFYRRSCYR